MQTVLVAPQECIHGMQDAVAPEATMAGCGQHRDLAGDVEGDADAGYGEAAVASCAPWQLEAEVLYGDCAQCVR